MKTRGVNVLVKGRKDDKYGYLKISVRKGGKTIIHSLEIKVLKKDFNPRTQLLRTNAPDAEKINEFIETKLSSLAYIPYKKGKIKSICVYIQKVIETTSVKSTKQKYENILTLFQEYLKINYKKDDLFFEDIDTFVVSGFKNYLISKAVKNTNNTANYKMKSFKSFFSKIKRESLYFWQVDPFSSIQLKFDDTSKDWLSFDEFKSLIGRDFEEQRTRTSRIKISLNDIKESFIFSTLAQGLRISDIMTLRWNDFIFDTNSFKDSEALIVRKKMIKTKKTVHVFLDNFSSQFLINSILRTINSGDRDVLTKLNPTIERLKICISDKKKVQNRINGLKSNDFFGDEIGGVWGENGFERISDTDSDVQKHIEQKDYLDNFIDIKTLDELKNELDQVNFEIFFSIYNLVTYLSKDINCKTQFVFPFLDDELFKNINDNNDFSQLTEKQFLQFQGKRTYINRLLKELIFKFVVPDKKLSFHSARHTYTSLILEKDEIGINLYDLMKSLGHSSILSTEKYISGFNYKKISQINISLNKSLLD